MSQNTKSVLDAADGIYDGLARQWLGANVSGVDLYIETSNLIDHINGPLFIRVRVDSEFLSMTMRRREFCVAEKLKNTTSNQPPLSWDTSRHQANAWNLFVDTECFWFEGKERYFGDVISKSHSISLDTLRNWLPGRPSPLDTDGENEMCWYGGALIFSGFGLDQFSAIVRNECPEVAAKVLEMNMVKRIAKSLDNAVVTETEPVAKRRRLVSL